MKKNKSKIIQDEAIDALLVAFRQGRKAVDFPTNKKGFDEDVDVYIAHLLYAVALPNYRCLVENYVSLDIKDVESMIQCADDDYLKYYIYKVNGDNAMLEIGINQNRLLDLGETLAKARWFYQKAASMNRIMHKKKTALSQVLTKLAKDIIDHTMALEKIRKQYYKFYCYYEDKKFTKFNKKMKRYEKNFWYNKKMDKFLELYNLHLKDRQNSVLKTRINLLAEDLKKMNKNFKFENLK